MVQDCFKTISVAAPNVLRSERVSFQNTNSQLDNSNADFFIDINNKYLFFFCLNFAILDDIIEKS